MEQWNGPEPTPGNMGIDWADEPGLLDEFENNK